MIITHICAHNFKTYVTLDLDMRVSPDRPIILIGGANGGGKTTFFQAIYGALYGLELPDELAFRQHLNAGSTQSENAKIELEISFTGQVLQQEKSYKLKRLYTLNPERKVVFNVTLSMDGSMFSYGSATKASELKENKSNIDKIINANLPRELSRYFLFDVLEAGNLLREDNLNRVIRDNIENVMGFKKYNELAAMAQELCDETNLQRQRDESVRNDYRSLYDKKNDISKNELTKIMAIIESCQDYSYQNRELYKKVKEGVSKNLEIEKRVQIIQKQIEDINSKEKIYYEQMNEFLRRIEDHTSMFHLQLNLKDKIQLALRALQTEQAQSARLSPEILTEFIRTTFEYLKSQDVLREEPNIDDVLMFLLNQPKTEQSNNPYGYLETAELKELDHLLKQNYQNGFAAILLQQEALNLELFKMEDLRRELKDKQLSIYPTNEALMKEFERNEDKLQQHEKKKAECEKEIKNIEKKLSSYDVELESVPDPRHEVLQKLRPFFESVSENLLLNKKSQIEAAMLSDLNANLTPYKDVIDRVELSDQLRDLSFKIYHKHGNEIYLNLLNTASKQVVVQVLLKALHEFGDYDPPVMIDTVMGALDKETRQTILQHYFPKLAHQTILLSSDSEIDPDVDYINVEPFVSKAYTLHRDKEQQCTTVSTGYFTKN